MAKLHDPDYRIDVEFIPSKFDGPVEAIEQRGSFRSDSIEWVVSDWPGGAISSADIGKVKLRSIRTNNVDSPRVDFVKGNRPVLKRLDGDDLVFVAPHCDRNCFFYVYEN